MSYSRPFVRPALLPNVHCVSSCWSGSRPLASGIPPILGPQRNSYRIACCCLSHGDPATMVLYGQTRHTLQQVIDEVNVGSARLEALEVGQGGS